MQPDIVRWFVDKTQRNVILHPMPTDGADFGRTRPCYGKAYTMARDGADAAAVAECVMRGVELDIRRDGGAPAFRTAVDLLVMTCSGSNNEEQLLAGVEAIARDFGDSPLTRHFAMALEVVGVSAMTQGCALSREAAEQRLLVRVAESRCCDGMRDYITRNLTKDIPASNAIVDSIKAKLHETVAVGDLAARMRNASSKGLPARPTKGAPVKYSDEGLAEEL